MVPVTTHCPQQKISKQVRSARCLSACVIKCFWTHWKPSIGAQYTRTFAMIGRYRTNINITDACFFVIYVYCSICLASLRLKKKWCTGHSIFYHISRCGWVRSRKQMQNIDSIENEPRAGCRSHVFTIGTTTCLSKVVGRSTPTAAYWKSARSRNGYFGTGFKSVDGHYGRVCSHTWLLALCLRITVGSNPLCTSDRFFSAGTKRDVLPKVVDRAVRGCTYVHSTRRHCSEWRAWQCLQFF